MGLFKDILGLSSINGSKEYRKRMLTGRDTVTGDSNYSVNTERRIKNLERLSSIERIETEPIENSQTVLYKIEELKRRLSNGNISDREKSIIKEHLNLLYEKYEELLDNEKSDSSYKGDYSRQDYMQNKLKNFTFDKIQKYLYNKDRK